jgi:hypothetical protein
MLSSRRFTILGALVLVLGFSTRPLPADTELIDNGHFDSGKTSWTLDAIQGAKGTWVIETGTDGKSAAHINVPETAAVAYYVQLFQNKLQVKAGQSYHLSFRAKAAPAVTISLNLMVGEAPWTNLWKQDVSLTSDWQDYSFDITPADSSANARVTFSRLGAQPADYWIADVSLIAK